jgi:hypothetical protein
MTPAERARPVLAVVLAAVLAAAAGSPACAHPSFAMFDQTRQVTLKGVVRAFQWTNPHAWVQLTVAGPDGQTREWAIEALSPNVLGRMGWKRTSLKPGDAVTAVINPTRDGSPAGSLIGVTDAGGRRVGNAR